MRRNAKILALSGLIFLLLGAIVLTDVAYAELRGLNLLPQTHTVNFVVTGATTISNPYIPGYYFTVETGHFEPATINIAPGDSVFFNVPIGQNNGGTRMFQPLWTVYLGVTAIGGNTQPNSQIPYSQSSNQYGEHVNIQMAFPAAGEYDVKFSAPLAGGIFGTFEGPSGQVRVNVEAPQVQKSVTVDLNGEGYVTGGLTSAKITDPAGQRFTVMRTKPSDAPSNTYAAPYTRAYPQYSQIDLNANPAAGWTFSHWLKNNQPLYEGPNCQFVLDNDASYTAVFVRQAVLTATGSPGGYFTVSPSVLNPQHSAQDSVYPGQTLSLQHDFGSQITVSAFPYSGYQFSHWQLPDGTQPTSTTTSFTLTSSGSITAIFAVSATPSPTPVPNPTTVVITFKVNGAGIIQWQDLTDGSSGTIGNTLVPKTFLQNHIVKLTAVDNGQTFEKYVIGPDTVTERTCQFTVTSAVTVNAYFTTQPTQPTATPTPTQPTAPPTIPPPTPTPKPSQAIVTFSANENQCEQVTLYNPATGQTTAITSFPSTAIFTAGQTFTITAKPKMGYTFTGWNINGQTVTQNPYTTTASNIDITANFIGTGTQPTSGPTAPPTDSPTPPPTQRPWWIIPAAYRLIASLLAALFIALGLIQLRIALVMR